MNAVITTLLATLLFSAHLHAFDNTSGGKTSVDKTGHNAFSQPAANLPLMDKLDFSVGNSFFRNPWVQAPATTDARDGLGPLFNTNGCQNCHIKDGRGHPPEAQDKQPISMLVRISLLAESDIQKQQQQMFGVVPEPTYGEQIQNFALPGHKPEAQIHVDYTEVPITFTDGTVVKLRKPNIQLSEFGFGPIHDNVLLSARVAPPMIGLGLLESIPEKTLTRWADPLDHDKDGISGRLNQVWDVRKEQHVIGRFGWKAGQPNLMQQNAAAFNGDLGLTTTLFPNENCTQAQNICDELPNGGEIEVSDKILNFVEFYSQHLAVPVRRNTDDPLVILGETLFTQTGCVDCHKPKVKTENRSDRTALSNQIIHPYTDLLLHDMGKGLADNREEYLASGQEWRTPPLWGLGYTQEVNGHAYFLHDGRARNELEAILWHGGEAESAKQQVIKFNQEEREAIVAFLRSL
ncbi:c-type cytochrome [Vibrio sp.]|nr:c-type cytochrome [Vibrio sp.]